MKAGSLSKRYVKYLEDEKILEETENEFKQLHLQQSTRKSKKSHRSDSEESDKNLPCKINYQKPQLSSKEYLKLYNQKN